MSCQQLISPLRSTGVEEKVEEAYIITTAAVVDGIGCGAIVGTFKFITFGGFFVFCFFFMKWRIIVKMTQLAFKPQTKPSVTRLHRNAAELQK